MGQKNEDRAVFLPCVSSPGCVSEFGASLWANWSLTCAKRIREHIPFDPPFFLFVFFFHSLFVGEPLFLPPKMDFDHGLTSLSLSLSVCLSVCLSLCKRKQNKTQQNSTNKAAPTLLFSVCNDFICSLPLCNPSILLWLRLRLLA